MTARPLTNTGTVSSVPSGWYDITAYGATTGASDNTTAIQAAITAAKTNGGTVYVPPGVFKYASQLVCDLPSKGFSISGPSEGMGELATVPSELRYTGSGATAAISCHSVYGFGLRSIRFTYDNAAGNFTGDLIDIDGGPHAADCTNWSVHDCGFKNLGAITARSMIRLNKAINGRIVDNGMAGAINSLRIGDPGGAYVVNVKVGGNTWNNATDAHILIGSGDAEKIVIDDVNSFEAGTSTTALRVATTAVDGANALLYAFEYANNWHGDAGAATNWITGLRAKGNGTVVLRSNFFGECGLGTHVTCDPASAITLISMGNHYTGGANVFSLNVNSTINSYDEIDGSTNLFAGTDRPFYCTLGGHASGATVANTPYSTLPPRVALGIGAAASAFPGDSLDAGPTGDQEQLILGAYSASTLKALGAKAVLYTRVKGGDPGIVTLQAASTDNTHEAQLAAGTTPTPQVRVSGVGVAFNNVAPVARPAAYTLNAGATSRNLPAAGTTLDVEKALRQLVTDLQANGLLQ